MFCNIQLNNVIMRYKKYIEMDILIHMHIGMPVILLLKYIKAVQILYLLLHLNVYKRITMRHNNNIKYDR